MLLSLIETEHPQYIFGAKDEKEKTKRHELVPEYKGHRPEMPDALVGQLSKIFDIFDAFQIPLFSEAGYEGDDFLATISEKYRKNAEYEIGIVSGDHDAFQLVADNVEVFLPQNGGKPALHLDRNGIYGKLGVYPEQVVDYKAMVGDSSDNLKGIDGIGPKTAAKLLAEYQTLEKILENADRIPGKLGEKLQMGKDIAILTKEMVTLHRNLELPNFGIEKGNVKNIDPHKLETFFRMYNFHSLINRLTKAFKKGENSAEEKEEEALWGELEAAQKTKFSGVRKKEHDDQMSMF